MGNFLKILALINGPDRARKIVAVCLVAAIALVLVDVGTGIITSTIYRHRIQTIQSLRQEAERKAAVQSPAARRALEETDILLEKVTMGLSRAEYEMRTPSTRLLSIMRPFLGGMCFWTILGLVVGLGSASLPEVQKEMGERAKPTGHLLAQCAAWFGVTCGLLGMVFNRSGGWWFTYVGFPLIAGGVIVVFVLVLAVLVGPKPASASVEADTQKKP
jgi:hypothetical protein